MRVTLAVLLLSLGPLVAPADGSRAVPLEVVPANGMPLVAASVGGVACTLLLDTGASHTTLDLGFVTNRLAGVALRDVELVGQTNVAVPPKFVAVREFAVGSRVFATEGLMALDLAHLTPAVGRRVDGILGMNHLRERPCLVSLACGRLVWDPGESDRQGFVAVPVRDRGTTFELMTKTFEGRRLLMLADTGSTFTFVNRAVWPADEAEIRLGTADVNNRADRAFARGREGALACGPDFTLTVRPVLTPETNRNQLGADVFRRTDLLIERDGLSLRPAAEKERTAVAPEGGHS